MYSEETERRLENSSKVDPQSNAPMIRRAPGIRLRATELGLLREAFPASESIFVEREFRSGYSGALVLLVSLDSAQAPVVVKLAHPHDLEREYNAYQQFVEKSAPQNTARLQGPPILGADAGIDDQLGALLYTFAGGDPHLPTSSLQEYIESQGADATVAMLNRLFRVYGRHWWAINHPHKFVLGEHYDHLLPVHLVLALQDEAGTPKLTLVAGEASIVDVRTAQVGDLLQLQNFRVAKRNSTEGTMTLRADAPEGEAAPPLRIRLVGTQAMRCKPGDQLALIPGTVRATRHTLLADAATDAMPAFAVSEESFAPVVGSSDASSGAMPNGITLRNPLRHLDSLLDRVVEARMSTVHGDMNLRNVLIDEQTGFAWLIDFADTKLGPTVFDLQRLEVQIFTKLLAERLDFANDGVAAVANIFFSLHADPPSITSPDVAYQDLYTLLVGIRRLARQYLMDDLDWDEYYLGLTVAFVGALKFDELDDRALSTALTAAAATKALFGVALFPAAQQGPSASGQVEAVKVGPEIDFSAQVEIAPPPTPQRPPHIVGFVGREDELEYFDNKLKRDKLAVISGMAGVGKTALAATLVATSGATSVGSPSSDLLLAPRNVFWHSFHEGEGIDVMVRKLAGFLAHQGQPALWHLLESTRQTGGQPPSADTLLDYLLQLLEGQEYLLCFDDFHFAEDDPTLNQLIERLHGRRATSNLSLLLTTRRMPEFVTLADFEPLLGLSLADARRLLSARGLHLDKGVIEDLHTLTAGNGQFLTLAANILQQAGDPAMLIENLAAADDVERYLLAAVDEGLSGAERSAMGAVSVLLNYPGTRDAIETVLNVGNVWRTLRLLQERHLLSVTDGEQGKEYRQHAIVQGFYYQELGRRQRRTMHHRAGEYYEQEEVDLLRAGIHYERAAAYELAAKQATADVWAIINRGQARALRHLLERFRAEQLGSEQWSDVNIAMGTNYAFLDERTRASESYQQALGGLEALSPSARVATLKARACRGMGELLELEKPEEALTWLDQGVGALDGQQIGGQQIDGQQGKESAALRIKRGTAQMYLAQYKEAQTSLEAGLRDLPETPSQMRSVGLMNLGSVFFFTGKLEAALDYYGQALAISQKLHDQFRIINILSNIGIGAFCTGDWSGAIEHFNDALRLAEALGSKQLQAEVEINLGAAYINTGDDAPALAHLESSLRLAQEGQLHVIETFAQFRMADLQIRLGDWATAAITIAKAEQLAQEINHRSSLVAIYRAWAEIKLAQDEDEIAFDYTQKSLELADELKETLERGSSLRVLGLVFSALQQKHQALAAFEESLNVLIDEEPYEAARTMASFGLYLLEVEQHVKGDQMIRDALQNFSKLGAKRDLARLETHMGEQFALS